MVEREGGVGSGHFCELGLKLRVPEVHRRYMRTFKVPLLWFMKGYFGGFGSLQQQVNTQGQKILSFSYNMHLFLPTPNDSLNYSFFQTPSFA